MWMFKYKVYIFCAAGILHTESATSSPHWEWTSMSGGLSSLSNVKKGYDMQKVLNN